MSTPHATAQQELSAAERWHAASEWWLIGAAVTFLAAFSFTVLQPDSPHRHVAELVLQLMWGLFVVDYVARLAFAKRRGHWFVTHLFDLALVLLPMIRPLRLLKVVTLIGVLQRSAGAKLRGRVVTYAAGSTVLLVYVAALAMLDTERDHPESQITTFGDAVWWAIATVTTVGYGDLSPVSAQGRVIAVGLMIGGIALLGVVTATLASWLIQRVAEQDEAAQVATRAQVAELTEQVRQLRLDLASARVPEPGNGN